MFHAHAEEEEFYELKRVAECVFPGARLRAAEPRPYEHPVRTSVIHWRGVELGRLFELHPSLLEGQAVSGRATLFDVDLEAAQAVSEVPLLYKPLRKYPTSGFDLSVVCALEHPVAEVQDELKEFGGEALVSIEFVRQYAGPPLKQGQKSVSYRLEVGSLDHTLTNEEVTEIRERVIEGMRAKGYELRV
jgi:phenylalanyl-tRNA synthetase beta chain